MKLSEHFDSFIDDIVNLNQTRIDRLEGHVNAIQDFLINSGYDAKIIRFSAQGSWAHGTIIKPLSGREFDADLVMFIDRFEAWSPRDYVNNLYYIFKSSDRYKDKISRGTRCVALDYAGDFHLDIVPCITDNNAVATFQVCNRTVDKFEPTAPEAYSSWLLERNTWTGNNMLQHSIRLLKYLRDIKTTFSVKSILLTTLVGNCVNQFDQSFQKQIFPDLPTSLKVLVGRLDDYLQVRSSMPIVTNPVLPSETFNRHWNQEKYENFRECIHRYREWIDDAYEEDDRAESIRKWRKIFGNEFAKREVNDIAAFSESTSLVRDTGCTDIVHAVLVRGANFLEKLISPSLPHVEKLSWPFQQRLTVAISATEYLDQYGNQRVRILQSGEVVEKDRWIRFEARNSNGILHASSDFVVKWQVVNTDNEAVQANQLRGGFEKSNKPGVRWESTSYHGAHWVEAFVISRRTRSCWGRSGRFFVVVK
ncbi:SMODS domain-containing nucleotidyltransferase [Acaryochloris sp. CCMEE 5410]|uniref:SMODS domain-containing nucleotidyltransferase n=1 Tax=Acaryochloris sp. CCMEE 5410 TaxID=310037 RepID=UPI0002485192|nr:nucleotidyltransferase [Acaryochloris sp. CCMEE 5410]KAI9130017.1 nucleotidyltransferase [Acaryochloris sp. CCMEE 5410]